MSVLLSIKPKYVKKIFSLEKKMEFRKKIWSREIKNIYLYASSPIQKIVGLIRFFSTYHEKKEYLWLFGGENLGGITKEEFDNYFKNKSHGYGIYIKSVSPFKKQIDPKSIDPQFKAPQDFMYLNKEFESKIKDYTEV